MRVFTALLLLPAFGLAAELKPFSTDGCSAFPEGTVMQQSLWFDCCFSHDMAYWKGGSETQRREADQELQQCVAQLGEEEIAELMYHGVRLGGTPHIPTPFRWGYGWPVGRGYTALSSEEKQQVREQLEAFQVKLESLSRRIGEELE